MSIPSRFAARFREGPRAHDAGGRGEGGRDWWKAQRKRPGAPSDMEIIRRIIVSFKPYRWRVLLVLLIILATTGLGLLQAMIVKNVFDGAIAKHDTGKLILYTSVMFAAPIISNLIGFAQGLINARISQNVMRDFRNRLYGKLQRLPLRFYTGTRSGEIQSRITSDVAGVSGVLGGTAPQIVSNTAMVAGSVVAMFAMSPMLTFFSLGLLPIFYVLNYRFGKIRRAFSAERQKTMASLSSHIHETLTVSGALLIKTFGRQEHVKDKFDRKNQDLVDLEMRQMIIGRWANLGFGTIFAAIPAITYLIAGWQMIKGTHFLGVADMTAGTILAITALQARFFGPAMSLFGVQNDIQASLALFDRIYEYLDLPVEIEDRPDALAIRPSTVRGEVSFQDVSFTYKRGAHDFEELEAAAGEDGEAGPKRSPAPALRNVSFTARPGQIVALVGPSGAGKTTIAQLIPRLYDATSGAVAIDGNNVKDISLASLSQIIGMVTQETFLLHASVRENLLYGRPDAAEEEMIAAAKAAAIHDTILQTDEGYDTLVGERGYRLSGGEKQRIAMARVILKDPRILILDEATSALDTRSEHLVQEAMDRLMVGRTSIVIAHRLSTVVGADLILVMENGGIVERGTHAELIKLGGLYSRLYQQQFANLRQEPVGT